jgi:DNA-binding response OmpR family regulator
MKRILIVEDELTILPFVSAVFRQRGYTVEAVSRYGDGIRLAQSSEYSLFLIDVRLRDGSGIDLCRYIRSLNKATPIVVYSGVDDYETLAIQAGANAFLSKGASLGAQLNRVISSLLGRQECPDAVQKKGSLSE